MKPILTKTRIITFGILVALLLAGCILYCKALEKAFTGDVALPLSIVNEGGMIALSAGDYRLDLVYSSDEDRQITIQSRDKEMLYSGILKKGSDQSAAISFINPKEDCSIEIALSESEIPFECTKLNVFSNTEIYRDSVVKAAFLFVIGLCLLCFVFTRKFSEASITQRIMWGLFACAACIRTLPFWYNGNVGGFDGLFHISRIVGLADGLRDGQFPATVYPYTYNGFGMLGRMYPDMTLYPVALLRLLGVSPLGAYQIFFILIGIVGAAVMYYCVRSITRSDVSASLVTIIFSLSRYHLEDVFYRNAMGEVTGMCFIPLVISGIYHIIKRDRKKGIIQLVAGCVAVINSHVLICIFVAMTGIFMLLFYCKESVKWPVMKDLLISAIFTLLIGTGTLVPMIIHMCSGLTTDTLKTDSYAGYGNTFLTMFGLEKTPIPSLGFPALVMFGILTANAVLYLKNKDSRDATNRFAVCMLVLSILFALFASSVFPWTLLGKIGPVRALNEYIQFVYRYFSVVVITLSMGGAVAAEKIMGSQVLSRYSPIVCTAIAAMFLTGGVAYVSSHIPGGGDMNRLYGGLDECYYYGFLPEGASEACFIHDHLFTSNPNINVTLYEKHGTKILCQFCVTEEYNHIDFPLFYYPGYTAKYYVPSDMSGKLIPVIIGDEGRIRVVLPQTDEVAAVEIEYKDPWYCYIAYIVSVAGLIALIIGAGRKTCQ